MTSETKAYRAGDQAAYAHAQGTANGPILNDATAQAIETFRAFFERFNQLAAVSRKTKEESGTSIRAESVRQAQEDER